MSSFENTPSWSDEFRWTKDLDVRYWNKDDRFWETEMQIYSRSKENSFCNMGLLHLKAIKKDVDGRHCVSARVNTCNKVSFLYGKIDVRAKAPVGKGIFPAIWMLPMDLTRPYGELDLMEYIDCWGGRQIQTNVHIVY